MTRMSFLPRKDSEKQKKKSERDSLRDDAVEDRPHATIRTQIEDKIYMHTST